MAVIVRIRLKKTLLPSIEQESINSQDLIPDAKNFFYIKYKKNKTRLILMVILSTQFNAPHFE